MLWTLGGDQVTPADVWLELYQSDNLFLFFIVVQDGMVGSVFGLQGKENIPWWGGGICRYRGVK